MWTPLESSTRHEKTHIGFSTAWSKAEYRSYRPQYLTKAREKDHVVHQPVLWCAFGGEVKAGNKRENLAPISTSLKIDTLYSHLFMTSESSWYREMKGKDWWEIDRRQKRCDRCLVRVIADGDPTPLLGSEVLSECFFKHPQSPGLHRRK